MYSLPILRPAMSGWVRTAVISAFSLFFIFFTANTLSAENYKGLTSSSFSEFLPDALLAEQSKLQSTYRTHRFVALPATSLFSPDPDQLRVQDLRNIECYAQPDALEVCGVGDTIPIMLFTKSVSPLQDIRLDVLFEDGIEYGGFAYVDNTLSDSGAELDTISTENPESPSFLLDMVSEATGGVIVYLGVRAECGVDFSINNPDITLNFSYTNADGVACTGSVTLEDYGGNVVTPKVVITNTPPNASLGRPGDLTCQSLDISQSTMNTAATGYIFTAANYGFEEGITIAQVSRGGDLLTAADYTIDATTGQLTLVVTSPTDDGFLDFNEIETVEVCYTYTECFPNVDFTPVYTAVSACDGLFCSGPIDQRIAGDLLSNFPQNPQWTAVVVAEQSPDVCTGLPYVLDIEIGASGSEPITDQIESIVMSLRRCKNPGLFLDMVELVSLDGATVFGAFDDEVYSVRSEDQLDSDDIPTANRAGTVTVDLRKNSIVSGGGLTDTDGDGFFDDLPGDQSMRIRFTFGVTCTGEELSCNSGPNVAGGVDPGADCQFTEIGLIGRTGCDIRNRSLAAPLTGTQNFDAESTSEYTNEETFNFGALTYSGYDFGDIGRSSAGGPLDSSTKPINFSYTLGDNDLFACDPVGTGQAKLQLLITGNEYLLDNMEFTDIAFNGMTVSPGKVTVERPLEGELLFTVDTGSVMSGVPFDYDFSVTLDTPRCAPPALLFVDAFLTTQCDAGCDCTPVRTCSSTTFTVDPDSLNCVCEYTVSTFVKRVNTNFEDDTRTTDVDPETISQQNIRRFVTGDTLEILYQLTVEPGADPDFNAANEFLDFRTDLRVTDGAAATSQNFQAMFDIQTARVQSFTINRKDGTEIDVGASISGDINPSSSGVMINTGATNSSFSYGFGEPTMPGFPNGGYTTGSGNSSNDDLDGRLLRMQFNNLNGQPDASTPFFDLVGGRFIGEDTINIVWHVVLIDNPSWNGMPSTLSLTGLVDARGYIGDPADDVNFNTDASGCTPTSEPFEYADPLVTGSSRIEYLDDCEATLVVRYEVSGIPTDWFTDEYRLVAGLEEFDIDFPAPYYYAGGATVETGGVGPTPVEPTASRNVDTATVGGQQVLFPNGTGTLTFVDAEKADGVRPDGYAGYGGADEALSDVITVGGTYPLLGFMGGSDDSLVFRIPLVRACSDEVVNGGGLNLVFDAANLYLPDLLTIATYSRSGAGNVLGEVVDNDGNLVDPDGNKYYPFLRLEDSPLFEAGFPISRERRINNVSTVAESGVAPAAIVSNGSVGMGFLTDDVGSETNTYTLCPAAGEILPGGALSIELSNSVELQSVSGDATSFTISAATDSTVFYAIEIPAENAVDDCFEITITTDLLFCDAGTVCMTPILGCPGSQIDITQQVNVYKELMLDCAPVVCYEYRGGTSEVDISFNLPTQSNLCSSQTYSILYTNSGSGPLSDLLPVIQIPTGLDVDLSSFEITLVGGTAMALTPPVANPDSNTIYGDGYVFDQTEIDAYLSPNVFEVGDIIIISFEAATSCDFIDGTPLAARLNAADACQEPQYIEDTTSDPNRVVQPDVPMPLFELDLPDLIQLSCSEEGTELLITTLNVGKAPTTEVDVMFTVPTGFSITTDNIEVISPSDFSIDEVVETDLGGGITMYSFTGPESVAIGGALCVKVMLNADDVDCGVYQLSAGFKQMTAPLECATDPVNSPCTLASLLSESSIFDVEVVPTVTIGTNNTITADCGPTEGTFNIAYELEVVAPSADYSGPAAIELYRDVNANGVYEPGTDQQLGTTMNVNVAVDSGATAFITGEFIGIDLLNVCPVLVRFSVPGCACGESVLSVMDILPTFVNDLGESVALCPGEEGMLTGICAPLDYSFFPISAGTVTDNGDGTVSFSLNPGVPDGLLQVTGTFGVCPVDVSIPVTTEDPFEFGPYTAAVCNEGSQEIDFNISPSLQEDLEILITPSIGLDDPTSFEPTISDLQSDQVYTVEFTLNGECTAETTLTVTVDEAPMVELTGATACLTGFSLEDALTLSPADLTGEFQTMGDGTFTTGADVPGATTYIPGVMDRETGSVSFRFITDDPEGPCGPDVARMEFTILLVDCGNFNWDGSRD